jgi:extracellular factor (EF) 3-hydroxypalmitic acid methyl ester biosynthesis protein
MAIDARYREAVRELSDLLSRARDGFSTDVAPDVTSLQEELIRLLLRFEEQARRIPSSDLEHRGHAQTELHPLLLGAPFAERCFRKPLGFAGDYEMVNMLLGESSSRGHDEFTRFINDVLTNVAVAQAHKNRIALLERTLAEETTRVNQARRMCAVLSVGCGPAVEIQRFARRPELSHACILHLVDFNDETLEHVRRRIRSILEGRPRQPIVKLLRQSIEEILATPDGSGDPRRATYDLVYCTGLFDYFTDDVCRELLRRYRGWLRPGGLLLASNVHPDNPQRHCMEHLVEWTLTHRDEDQLRALSPRDGETRVHTDATGLNVFISLRS